MAAVLGSAVALLLAFGYGLLAAALHAERRPFQTHHVHLLLRPEGVQRFFGGDAAEVPSCLARTGPPLRPQRASADRVG